MGIKLCRVFIFVKETRRNKERLEFCKITLREKLGAWWVGHMLVKFLVRRLLHKIGCEA